MAINFRNKTKEVLNIFIVAETNDVGMQEIC